jgi:hypothetical protein
MLMFAPYLATLSEENSQKTPLVPTRQREPASEPDLTKHMIFSSGEAALNPADACVFSPRPRSFGPTRI